MLPCYCLLISLSEWLLRWLAGASYLFTYLFIFNICIKINYLHVKIWYNFLKISCLLMYWGQCLFLPQFGTVSNLVDITKGANGVCMWSFKPILVTYLRQNVEKLMEICSCHVFCTKWSTGFYTLKYLWF